MRKAVKIVIVVVVAIVALFFIGALVSGPYVNRNVSDIQGIGDFVVLHQGSQYIARFSLIDDSMGPAAADVKVELNVPGWRFTPFDVAASEFKTYQLKLTGQEFIAYAWTLPDNFYLTDPPETATIKVTLPDGRAFTADTTVF